MSIVQSGNVAFKTKLVLTNIQHERLMRMAQEATFSGNKDVDMEIYLEDGQFWIRFYDALKDRV